MRGTSTPRLDDKWRLTLPIRHRTALTNEITVVCAPEHCLFVYPTAVLDDELADVNNASPTWRRVRDYQRWINSRAEDVTPDGQGRITLTAAQREWAGLDKDVVVVGSGKRLEVWNPERWVAYRQPLDDQFEDFDGEIVPRS